MRLKWSNPRNIYLGTRINLLEFNEYILLLSVKKYVSSIDNVISFAMKECSILNYFGIEV